VNSHCSPCLDDDSCNDSWKRALSNANVKPRRAYNCRHTYASLGLKAGAKPAFLASQLGHSLEMFYNTYAKWITEEDDLNELKLIEEYQRGGSKGGSIKDNK